MRRRINPVLPPPRRPRMYGWVQDTTYQGSQGGKWVGTEEHQGQTRYQEKMPGSRSPVSNGDDVQKEAAEPSPKPEKTKGKKSSAADRLRQKIESDPQSAELAKQIAEVGDVAAGKWQAVRDFSRSVQKAQDAWQKAEKTGSKEDADAAALMFTQLIDEHKKKLDEARAYEDGIRSKVHSLLKLKKGTEILLYEDQGTVSKDVRVNALDARDWLSAITNPNYKLHVSIKETDPGVREHATHGSIVINKKTTIGVIIHEFCHHLEKEPRVQKALNTFLEERCGDEPYRYLNDVAGKGWDYHEQGRKDDFEKAFGKTDAWYVGKTYSNGQSELLSMTVQLLYEDPVKLASKDPELCAFVIGLLHGRIKL